MSGGDKMTAEVGQRRWWSVVVWLYDVSECQNERGNEGLDVVSFEKDIPTYRHAHTRYLTKTTLKNIHVHVPPIYPLTPHSRGAG